MKLNKRFFAVLMAAIMMLVCAVPVFAEGANAPANVATSFTVMGYGMLGIFIVMIIIMLVILLLNVATKPRKK